MNAMSRKRHWVVLATAALSLTLACQFEVPTPELQFSLNTKAIEDNSATSVACLCNDMSITSP